MLLLTIQSFLWLRTMARFNDYDVDNDMFDVVNDIMFMKFCVHYVFKQRKYKRN